MRIALSEEICPLSTTLASRISAVVTSKLAFAVSMKELPVSMMRCRSSPVPPNAAPSSVTVVRSAWRSTDDTVVDRFSSSVSVWMGVRVSSVAISEASSRYGSDSACGCSSTYCSPTAERLPTTARVSAGIEE